MKVKLDREQFDRAMSKALRKDAKEINRMTFTQTDDTIYFGRVRDAMILLAKHYEP